MPSTERTGVLFTRSDLPAPAQRRNAEVCAELDSLVERGDLAALDVVGWEKRVPREAPSPERERHAEFEAWAAATDRRLTPFFDTRRCYAPGTCRRREELVLPAMCLAVYQDGTLTSVAPHVDGRETVSVEDAIERLAGTEEAHTAPVSAP
jgi:hypothetical protein